MTISRRLVALLCGSLTAGWAAPTAFAAGNLAAIPDDVVTLMVVGVVLPVVIVAAIIWGQRAVTFTGPQPPPFELGTPRYEDRIVRIYRDGIWMSVFYVPWGSKFVPFSAIDFIESRPVTLGNGKLRLWGSGDFRTWFPLDSARPKRDAIFWVFLKGKWARIAFTAENSAAVAKLLSEKVPVRSVS